jgi:AraC-like DNA-binding protein
MNFKTFLPDDALKPYVKYFYTMETDGPSRERKTYRTIADGCPGMLFQKSSEGRFYQDEKELPGTFLFGQSTRHADLCLTGNFNAAGVFLKPHALSSIFGLDAGLLTDSCMDMRMHAKGKEFRLSEKLEEAKSGQVKIELLRTYLIKELKENCTRNNQVMQYALEKIQKTKGTASISALQHELCLTERSFERKFKQYTGIPPKLFSRICNFQASLKQLNKNDFHKLSDIAYENNYADQSHFIRSFKEFAGFSPNQFQKRSDGIVENLAELVF